MLYKKAQTSYSGPPNLRLLVFPLLSYLLENTGNETGSDCASTLTHVESLTCLENVGLVKLADHLDIVTGHDLLVLLNTLGPAERTALVGRSDEHLWPVVLAETSVATTLLLAENVHGDEELPVSLDGSGNGNDHTTADVLALHTTEEETRVVTSARLIARLLEGLNVGDLGLDRCKTLADKLDFRILLQDTTLDTARADGSTTGNGEDVLDGHEEGLVGLTLGSRNPSVNSLEQLINLGLTNLGLATLDGAEGRTHDDGRLVTLETIGRKQLAHLHLDKLQHLLVLNGVDLVDEDDNLLDTDLAGEQQVLTGLGHLTVRSSNDDDGTVHVCRTCNHVLDVIGVTRAVDVGIMPVIGRVLDVCCGNGDTTLSLFRSFVDGAIVEVLCVALLGLSLCDGGCEGGLLGGQFCEGEVMIQVIMPCRDRRDQWYLL